MDSNKKKLKEALMIMGIGALSMVATIAIPLVFVLIYISSINA
jgi:hypothetical protein